VRISSGCCRPSPLGAAPLLFRVPLSSVADRTTTILAARRRPVSRDSNEPRCRVAEVDAAVDGCGSCRRRSRRVARRISVLIACIDVPAAYATNIHCALGRNGIQDSISSLLLFFIGINFNEFADFRVSYANVFSYTNIEAIVVSETKASISIYFRI